MSLNCSAGKVKHNFRNSQISASFFSPEPTSLALLPPVPMVGNDFRYLLKHLQSYDFSSNIQPNKR